MFRIGRIAAARIFCLGIGFLGLGWTASAAPVTATPSDAFVDSIGVNIHATHYLGFATTAYDDWPSVINAVGNLGIRNVRDHIFDTDRLNQLTAATGAQVTAIIEKHAFLNGNSYLSLDESQIPTLLNLARSLTGLAALEGPSEYDQYSDPNWVANLKSYQMALYNQATMGASPISRPVLAPSITDRSLYATFSDLAPYADRGNVHSYPGYSVPTNGLANWVAASAQMVGPKAPWSTETGYHNALLTNNAFDVSQTAAGKYVPRLLMEYFRTGVEKTFLYELVDDNADPTNSNSENNLGLLNNNFSLKPSGTAVKNLIALLKDPGAPQSPSSLDYTLTGGNPNLRQVLFQKHDGTFWLALWQDVSVFDKSTNTDLTNPDLPITLIFSKPLAGAEAFLPNDSISPTATYGAFSQLNLNVPDRILLVELTPTPEPSSMIAILGVTLVLAQRRRNPRPSR